MQRHSEISIGDKIGVVTILDKVYNNDRKEWEYICECRCGNRFKTRKDHLTKPRQGCKACINKVKADIDLSNTITRAEYNKVVEAKEIAKEERHAAKRAERAARRAAYQAQLDEWARMRRERREKYERSKLTHPIWIGQRFGRLTVIDSYVADKKTRWILQCDCGNIIDRKAGMVNAGQHKSCGCISREIIANAVSHERLYGVWRNMNDRCLNPNNNNYHNYGGRGIKICDEWKNSYEVFRNWAYENGWTEEIPDNHRDVLSIERINVNGNYEPSNCCFIPLWKQIYNRRQYSERTPIKTKKDTTIIEINGVKKSRREWQEFYNIKDATLNYRLSIGMTMEEALSTKKYDISNKKLYKAHKQI